MDDEKSNEKNSTELDLKSMSDKQKKKLSDLKKEQNKIEKDKDKIEVDILKKLVDDMKGGKEEDEEDEEEEDEGDGEKYSMLTLYEEIKKRQEETDVHVKANQLLFNMLFGLQSSTQGDKETEQFVTDGQEKRNEITQQILLKAAKADEMERKHKQYQNVFKDLFGTTQDKIATPNPASTKRKAPSESEELVKKKKAKKTSSTKDSLLQALEKLKKSKSTR